jgi:hypothetical protein
LCAKGQSGKLIYNDHQLHEIYITITLPHWLDTLDLDYLQHRNFPDSFPEVERLCAVVIDGKKVDSVGLRERGNFSNVISKTKYKRPFKLVFDAFINQRFDEVKSLNLNNCTDDPSFVREALAYRLMRDEKVPAPRTSYAKVYINGLYWGLYLVVESIDKTFLKDYYGSKGNDGNLYKTSQTAQAFLNWMGTADSAYQDESGLELKSYSGKEDWRRLIHFIDIINHIKPDSGLLDSLNLRFNIDQYLNVLAIEKLVFNWDSYWGGGNNYYLYEHPDGRIYWLPWDINESFARGDDFFSLIIPSDNYLLPTNNFDDRPLLKALLNNEKYKTIYFDKVCAMLNNHFQIGYIDSLIYQWHHLTNEAVFNDSNKLYTYEAYNMSLTQSLVRSDYILPASGVQIKRTLPGIIPFIQERCAWAAHQMALHGYTCNYPELQTQHYTMQAYPNPSQQPTITLTWTEPQNGLCYIQFYDMQGRLIYTHYRAFAENNQLLMNVPTRNSGMYIIRKIDASGKVGVCKWVVE